MPRCIPPYFVRGLSLSELASTHSHESEGIARDRDAFAELTRRIELDQGRRRIVGGRVRQVRLAVGAEHRGAGALNDFDFHFQVVLFGRGRTPENLDVPDRIGVERLNMKVKLTFILEMDSARE